MRDITESKRATEKAASMADMADLAPSLIIVRDPKGNILYANERAHEMCGYSREDFMTLNIRDLEASGDITRLRSRSEEIVERGQITFEIDIRRKDGSTFTLEALAKLIKWEGNPAILSVGTDITERRHVQAALRESEEQYRELFTQMQQAVSVQEIVQDETGRVIDYILIGGNPSFEKAFNLNLYESRGMSIKSINPSVSQEMIQTLGQVALTGEPYTQEYYSARADRYFQVVSYSPRRGHFASIHTDITDIKFAEKSLRKVNEDLSALNRYSIEQNDCRTYQDLIELIAQQLAEHSHAVMVAINEYDPEKKVLITKHIQTDKHLLSLVLRLGGERIEKVESPVSDEMYREIVSSSFGYRDTLTEVTFGAIPRNAGQVVQKALGVGKFVCIALMAEGRLQATVVMALKRISHAPSEAFITSYAHLSSTSLARMKAEERVRHMSFHDQLTGLYNRHYLEEEIKKMDTVRQLPLSVIMADLDGLKVVNDTYGHLHGDEMLKAAASIVKGSCRTEDVVARWGGDEYVVLLPQTGGREAESICRRIAVKCKGLNVGDVPVSISLGFATKMSEEQDLVKILHEAEDDMYKNKLAESRSTKSAVLHALLKALAEKSHETEAHTQRMKEVALRIGEQIGIADSELNRLKLLITLHDIGKINIPEEILTRKGLLSPAEWEVMKTHPEVGYRIARATQDFVHVAEDILAHHERWDGTGYPQGLKGREIPLLARITSIADAYEVMTNGRPYKPALTRDEVIAELKRCAGTQFDPELVKVFLSSKQ